MDLLKLVFQLFHLVLAAAILLIGVVEFSVEPSIFDVFGRANQQEFPIDYQVSYSAVIHRLCNTVTSVQQKQTSQLSVFVILREPDPFPLR